MTMSFRDKFGIFSAEKNEESQKLGKNIFNA